MEQKVTKAWKIYAPTLAKKERSVHWDWSNEQDGIRIFETFNADLTGHTSYFILRITRNTEAECYDEFHGQLTDVYFENYRGEVRGEEVSPDSVKIKPELVLKKCEEFELEKDKIEFERPDGGFDDTAMVVLNYYGLTEARDALSIKIGNAERTRRKLFGWNPEDTPENRAEYDKAIAEYRDEIADAYALIRETVSCGKGGTA